MNEVQQFPFALELESVSQWLTSLNLVDTILTGSELHKVIKNLAQAQIDSELLFEIINKITPVAENITDELQQKFLEKSIPADKKNLKLKRLGRHLIKELISVHHLIANKKNIATGLQQKVIHQALKLIGQHLLISAKMNEKPSTSIWKISGQFYQLAQAPLSNSPIADTVKRNILFSISQPYQFAAFDIDLLYLTLTNHCQLANLQEMYSQSSNQCYFVWEYQSNITPNIAVQNESYRSAVFLNTDQLINFFQTAQFKAPFQAFQQIMPNLSGYQKIIHSDIPSEPKICNVYAGFEQIEKFLKKQIRTSKLQHQSHDPVVNNTLMGANLEPLEHENSFLISNKPNIWKQEPISNNAAKILKTQSNQFIVAVLHPGEYCNEDLVIIVNDNNHPELGIIRRINYIHQSNTHRVLIELVSGTIEIVDFKNLKPSTHAILIQSPNHPDELMLSPGSYLTGSTLTLEDKDITLEKLTEITNHFMRYQVRIH